MESKKVAALVLAGAMAVTTMAGCGSAGGSDKYPGKDITGDPDSNHVYCLFSYGGILFSGSRDDRRKLFRYPVWTDAADYKRSGRIPERDLLCEYENCLGYRYTE